jgi:hypothetical protein
VQFAMNGNGERIEAFPKARAVGPSWRSGWRDIASAPKDGTKILVCDRNEYPRRIWTARWWRDNWQNSAADILLCLTHWQPLPAPPAAPQGGDIELPPGWTREYFLVNSNEYLIVDPQGRKMTVAEARALL